MHTNEIVQARTNPAAKAEAEGVLAAMGLTVSDAFQMMIFALPPKRQGLSSRWFPVTHPPEEPGAFVCEPPEAARRGASAAPRFLGHQPVADQPHSLS